MRGNDPVTKRVGILDLAVDSPNRTWGEQLYSFYFRKQFVSITPQAISVWCRRLGHRVHYACYRGQGDPASLLPDDLDVLFVSSYTQASALAYALAKLFRKRGALTVIGGPHARSFPSDCLRFFDLAVTDCDQALIADILSGHADRGTVVSSNRPLTEFPTVEERMPEIRIANFHRGRPILTSLVPLLASIGCPYSCNFCVDWNKSYVALPKEQLAADLRYLSDHFPKLLVGYHDPNFAVRFDETMDIIETIPAGRRNPYIMESSLSILKGSRLPRLTRTNCVYVAPGVESWSDYTNKAGAGDKCGVEKLEQVVAHFDVLSRHVPGLQANFLFGADVDRGREPVELTKSFIRRLPAVWPTINIPSPFGGTPLYDELLAAGRILQTLPFAFYYNPYLAITLKHYDPVDYYDHLIELHEEITSSVMLTRRLTTHAHPAVRFVHALRTLGTRRELAEFRELRAQLAGDRAFRAFHEKRSDDLPDYYHRIYERRLGRYAELMGHRDRIPRLEDVPGAIAA
jgi:hypothetical protein